MKFLNMKQIMKKDSNNDTETIKELRHLNEIYFSMNCISEINRSENFNNYFNEIKERISAIKNIFQQRHIDKYQKFIDDIIKEYIGKRVLDNKGSFLILNKKECFESFFDDKGLYSISYKSDDGRSCRIYRHYDNYKIKII